MVSMEMWSLRVHGPVVVVLLLLVVSFLPARGGAESEVSGGGTPSPQAAVWGRPAGSGAELAAVESRAAESGAVEDQGSQQDCGRKIVKTADLTLRDGDVRAAAAEAQRVAAELGGSVLSSETYR
jgi:hypothetical protein